MMRVFRFTGSMALMCFALSPLSAWADAKNYSVKIDGMTCAACVKSVTSALSKVPGIDAKSVSVVLKENKASLTVTEDKADSADQIKKAIESAGYKVVAFETVPASKEQKKN